MAPAHDARRGLPHTPEARARISAAHRARGTRPPKAGRPWAAEEDALALSALPAAEVASRTGRAVVAVVCRRNQLRRAGSPAGP